MDRRVKVYDDLILGYGSKSSKAGVSCISEPGSSVYSFTGRTHIQKSFLKNATAHLFFLQCHKFSQSGVPSPDQLSSLIEFIDEFIFK